MCVLICHLRLAKHLIHKSVSTALLSKNFTLIGANNFFIFFLKIRLIQLIYTHTHTHTILSSHYTHQGYYCYYYYYPHFFLPSLLIFIIYKLFWSNKYTSYQSKRYFDTQIGLSKTTTLKYQSIKVKKERRNTKWELELGLKELLEEVLL